MKKIISLILTVAMLMSVATFVAPVSAEQTREEFLNAPAAEYVELNLFHDAFATYAERQSTDWYGWESGNITKIWPYKGVFSGENASFPRSRSAATSDYAFMIDLGAGKSTYTNGVDLKTNPNVSYDETLERYIVNANGIKYKLGKIEEGKFNGNYAGIGIKYNVEGNTIADGLGIKEQTYNTSVYPNIGTASESQKATYSINKSGVTAINLLMTNMLISSANKKFPVYVPGTIEYTDGSKTEIGLLVGNGGSNFQDSMIAVPKGKYSTYDAVNTNGVAAYTVAGKEIVNSNINLPHLSSRKSYIPEYSMQLATIMRNYKGGEFDGYVHSYSIPVDATKTVKSITLNKNNDISTSFFSSSESLANGTAGTAKCLIPFTIDGVGNDYTYYVMSTRNCSTAGIFAMTLTYPSLQDEIDAIETRIEALDKPYNSEQKDEIAKIMSDIEAVKVKGVLEDDFDDALITKLNDLYAEAEAEIKKARIEEFENKIDALADKYSNTMKSTVEAVIAEREALLTSGFISNDFDSALFTKLTKLEEVYTFANNIETKVNGWGNEYLYTMYNDVKKVKEDADGLKENEYAAQDALSSATTTKIEKMNSLAKEASAIDDSISALADEYTEAILEDLEGIKASMDTFKTNGGTDNGIIPENLEKFNKLYDDAQADIEVKAKEKAIADFKESVDALGEKYTADKKDALENAIEKYDAAIALGVTETELGASLAKYNELCEIYKLAVKLEEAVSKWPAKYSISYYDEVISKKAEYDSFVEMEEAQAISEKTVEKINSFYNVASKAAKIDEEIAKLPEEYETSVLATLKKLNQEIEALYEEGASEGAFANISKFNSLYANVEEANKFLYERTQQFVSLEGVANIDLFASWKDITNYARFLYNAKGSNAYVVGDLTSTHTLANGSIINLCIPTTTYEGMEIKGNAAYYKKGINIPAMQMVSNIFVLDDLLEKNGTVVKGYRYNTANVTSTDAAGGSVVRTVAEKTVKSGHVVNVLESGKYAIVENNGTQTKVGPLSKTADTIAYNAIYLSGGSVTAPVGLKGKILSCMLITNNINTQFTYADCVTQKNPVAGVQNMEISYKDGSTVKKFAIIKKASTSDGIIWYAPKKDKWTADDLYGAKRVDTVKQLTAENINEHGVELSDIKPEDFTFEDENVVMAAQAELASLVGARQETMTTAYNNAANLVSIPVEEKEIASLKLDKVYDYRTMAIKGSIVIEGTGTRQAFIPVEIKGANEEYDYFVFVGGLTNDTYLAGITVEGESIMDTIVETEEMISELSDEFNEKEIEKLGEIKSNIDALAAKGVSEYDYDADLYEKFNQIYTSPEAKEAIDAYVYNNPQIVSVEKYTDLDNMTYTVKFSAPITQASVTKELFSVTKNGEGFSGYEVNAVKTEEQIYAVEVIIPNDYNYSDVYSLTVSKKVMGMGNSLKEGYTGEYDAPQAVQAEVTYADGEGMVVLTNNMNYEQVVTAVVAVYGSDNQMSKRYVVSEKLAKGESIEQAIAFDLEEGQKVECLVLDNFANSRKVYNTYIFE